MSWGGKRVRSGRKAGIPNHLNAQMRGVARAQLAGIVGTKRDPLLLLIEFASDESLPKNERASYAALCLPFVHPRLHANIVDVNRTNTDMKITFDFGRDLGKRLEPPKAEPPIIEAKPEPERD